MMILYDTMMFLNIFHFFGGLRLESHRCHGICEQEFIGAKYIKLPIILFDKD